MGLQVSHCIGDTCVGESEQSFVEKTMSSPNQIQQTGCISDSNGAFASGKTISSVSNSPQLDQRVPEKHSEAQSLTLSSVEPLYLQLDTVESPRSIDSNESVLTVISPTKESRLFSPSKRSRSLKSSNSVVSPSIPVNPSHDPLEITIGKLGSNSNCASLSDAVLEDIYSCVVRGDITELEGIVEQFGVDLSRIQLQALHYSPLHVAVIHDQPAMASYLIDQGVDTTLTDKDGQTATYLAYTLGRSDLAALLVSHRANEFTTSPFSPYGSNGTSLNDGGSVRSRVSGGSRYEDLNSTFSAGVITVSRDSSFRSNKSIDFPIQHNTTTTKSNARVRPASFNFTSGAPVLQRARTDPVRASRSVSFSDEQQYEHHDNNFNSTVTNGSVLGTIFTTLSFDEKDEEVVENGMSSQTKAQQLTAQRLGVDALRFGFQSPAHTAWLQSRLDNLCQPLPVDVSRASNKECDQKVDQMNRAWHAPFEDDEPLSTVHSVSSSVHDLESVSAEGTGSTSTNNTGMHKSGVHKPLGKRLRKAAGKMMKFMHVKGEKVEYTSV